MASKFICRKNKFGYCWYGEKCKNKHVNELCKNKNCEIFSCEKRHPKTCKYKRDYGYCKFQEYCRFNHEKPVELIEVVNKMEIIEIKIETLKSTDCSQDVLSLVSDMFEKKFEAIESKVNNQRKDLDAKNSQIHSLEVRLDELEKKYKTDKQASAKKIKELENIEKKQGKTKARNI